MNPQEEEQHWECVKSHINGLGHLDFHRAYSEIKVGCPLPVFHVVEAFASKTAEWVLGVYIVWVF